MVDFVGTRYSSSIAASEVADDPREIGQAWLVGREAQAFNADDAARVVLSAGQIDARTIGVGSEGAVEWYAAPAPRVGGDFAFVSLPGVSRMYLPALPDGDAVGYALVFHPTSADCETVGTLIAPGSTQAATVVSGGVRRYGSGTGPVLVFAINAALDGSIDAYFRSTDAVQEVRLFERTRSGVSQNVLLATLQPGQTVRLQFAPSPTFVPYVAPRAVFGVGLQIAAAGPYPDFSVSVAQTPAVVRDFEFGGHGRIWGDTAIKGTVDVPTRARVILLRQRDKLLVRETWSDPITGQFEFAGIDQHQEFLALVEDAAGNYRPVAASRLVPEAV